MLGASRDQGAGTPDPWAMVIRLKNVAWLRRWGSRLQFLSARDHETNLEQPELDLLKTQTAGLSLNVGGRIFTEPV